MLDQAQKNALIGKCVRLLKYEKDSVEKKFIEQVMDDILNNEDENYPCRADVARINQRYERLKKGEELIDAYWMFFEGEE